MTKYTKGIILFFETQIGMILENEMFPKNVIKKSLKNTLKKNEVQGALQTGCPKKMPYVGEFAT